MSTTKKILIGAAFAAGAGAAIIATDYQVTKHGVRDEVRTSLMMLTGGEENHKFYTCVADKAAPTVAGARISDKYQRLRENYLPFMPITIANANSDSPENLIGAVLGDEAKEQLRLTLEVGKHIPACLKEHGNPTGMDLEDMQKHFKNTNGMEFHINI